MDNFDYNMWISKKIDELLNINVKVKEFDINKYPEIGEIILKTEKELEGEGRVLIRKSGTEPLFRIMLEGKDKKYQCQQKYRIERFILDVDFIQYENCQATEQVAAYGAYA